MKSLQIKMAWLLFGFGCNTVCFGAVETSAGGAADDSILLNQAVTAFLQSVDSGKIENIISFYDPAFKSIRVVDQGSLVQMDRQQMINFWKMIAGKTAGTGGISRQTMVAMKTTIHLTEIINDLAYVLLTRIKDLGSGPEPMFYNLIWKKSSGHWYLFREIVHQKTMPRL